MPETPKLNLLYSCVQLCIFVQKTLVQCKQIVTGHHITVADMSSKGLLVLVKSYRKQNPILCNRISDKMGTKARTSRTFQVLPLSWWSLQIVNLLMLQNLFLLIHSTWWEGMGWTQRSVTKISFLIFCQIQHISEGVEFHCLCLNYFQFYI